MSEPNAGVPFIGTLEDHIMPNPSMPHLLVKLTRKGQEDTLTVYPESIEWVLSTEGADMLKFTVPDPEYLFINHPMLVGDFKTEVEFRFGYSTNMSEIGHMRFFKQRPTFPENGAVKTTVVCYDLSVFLTLPIKGATIEQDAAIKIEDIVEANLRAAEEQFGIKLEPVYDNCEFENEFYRVGRPHGRLMDSFTELSRLARVKNVPDETMLEVYVEDTKLHFHPPRRRFSPIGAFAYFSELPGARLLNFEPQTNLQYTPKKVETTGINSDTGMVEGSESTGASGERRPSNSVNRTDADQGTSVIVPSRGGDTPEQSQPVIGEQFYTVTGQEGNNLLGIIEQFPGSSLESFIEANGIDPDNIELAPGDVLTVPILEGEQRVETVESVARARAEYLDHEARALNANATVLGNPRLRAGWPIDVFNVGPYEGRWYVRECSHLFSESGYRVNFNLTREGFAYGDGLIEDGNVTPAYAPVEPEDAADQEEEKARTDAGPGTTEIISR